MEKRVTPLEAYMASGLLFAIRLKDCISLGGNCGSF